MEDIVWDKLSARRQAALTRKVKSLALKFARIDYGKPAHCKLSVKVKFMFCRAMQKSLHKADPEYLDGRYWAQQGWLGSSRPWR